MVVTITNMCLLGLKRVISGTVFVVWQSGVGDKSFCLGWAGAEKGRWYEWDVGSSWGGVGCERGNGLSGDGDKPC